MSVGFLDFLFQGSPPKSVTTKATSTTTVPDWMQEYIKADLSKASSIAGSPYQSYTGPRIAPLTQNQNNAYTNIANNQGNWQPALSQAMAGTAAAGNPGLDQNAFNSYLSPYIGGVLNNISTLGARNLSENLIPQINTTFTGSGQWGGSRNADFMGRAVRDTSSNILQQQASALQQSYDSAMGNYQAGQNRSLSAAGQQGALAQQLQGQGLQDAAALEAAGQSQQQQQQKNLDLGYQDFTEQRDYDKNNTNWIMSLLSGAPQQSSTTTTNNGPASVYSPSPLSTIAGSLSLLQGLKFKKGGQVPSSGAMTDRERQIMEQSVLAREYDSGATTDRERRMFEDAVPYRDVGSGSMTERDSEMMRRIIPLMKKKGGQVPALTAANENRWRTSSRPSALEMRRRARG